MIWSFWLFKISFIWLLIFNSYYSVVTIRTLSFFVDLCIRFRFSSVVTVAISTWSFGQDQDVVFFIADFDLSVTKIELQLHSIIALPSPALHIVYEGHPLVYSDIIAVVCLNSAVRHCVLSAITVLWFLLLWKSSTLLKSAIWHPFSPCTICIHNRAYSNKRPHSYHYHISKYELACWPLVHKFSENHPSGQKFLARLILFSGTNVDILSLCFRSVHLPIIGCHRWKAGTTDQ